jgi:hypothetical protein
VTIEEILQRLDRVSRKPRGFMARCPAHQDIHPSLSVAEGDRGILLRCWAGCSLADICAAVGIQQRDLFYDARPDPVAMRQRYRQRRECERQREQEGLRLDVLREAEATIAAAQGMEIYQWSAKQLEAALNKLADVYAILDTEGVPHG